jgi:hypothetical protein
MTEDPAPPGSLALSSEPCGWLSDLPAFCGAQPRVVRLKLQQFVRDAGAEQLRAWDESIPWLQRECKEAVDAYDAARTWSTILEYELPREGRRPDVIVLENGVVVVLEVKGKSVPSQADIDQVFAYARDLRSYHCECADRPVHAVLVPSRGEATPREVDGVQVVGPAGVDRVLLECIRAGAPGPLTAEAFLNRDAYSPLPSLVRAARDLFAGQPLPRIKRAHAATDPAVARITAIAREAAAGRNRHLVLLTGVPGSGKTLVGLQMVHAGFLDDLSVARAGGKKPAAPAVFLSGNAPLVMVLQDALKEAGGGGKVFVRDVKHYVRHYSRRAGSVPPEHLLIFDEAQRAWDADHVRRKHTQDGAPAGASPPDMKSEPEHFIEFAERIPEWCVVVGLVGSGQEIHTGEEGGLVQWRRALEGSRDPLAWTVHAPPAVAEVFAGSPVRSSWTPALNLDTEIRFHLAPRLHQFVELLLADGPSEAAAPLADEMFDGGLRFYFTRDLEVARRHARERYAGAPEARYGLLASSKDKDLPGFGVDNSFPATRRVSSRIGRWYNAPQDDPESCCRLDTVATEFSAQGMELDLAVLAWGSDYVRRDGRWTIARSGRTNHARDQHRLRQNVYRVLLTRGRDGTVIFLPPGEWYEETAEYLQRAGVRRMAPP